MTILPKVLVVILGIGGVFLTGASIALFLSGPMPDPLPFLTTLFLISGITCVVLAAYLSSLPNWGGRS